VHSTNQARGKHWHCPGLGACVVLGFVPNSIHLDRARDVLDALGAEILESKTELVQYLVTDCTADANSARLGQRLQARRDIDAVAEDIVVVDDDVTDVDSDSEFNTLFRCYDRIALGHPPLNVDRTTHGIDYAGKFQQAVLTIRPRYSAILGSISSRR
jgi:hypothetical protein